MKAIVIHRYGTPDVLELVDLPTPVPGAGEVLIHTRVIAINPYDCMARSGEMKMLEGFSFPKILGCESAGEVVRLGDGVTQFSVGDRVICFTGRNGSYVEFITRPAEKLVRLPQGVDFKDGASLPVAGSSAYVCLHTLGKIQKGFRVLINGAYGGVGSFAVQLAKLAEANVTAVCSTPSIVGVRALGADEVVDYRVSNPLALQGPFDIILDTPNVWRYTDVKHLLGPKGVYVATVPTPGRLLTSLLTSFTGRKCRVLFAAPANDRIAELARWLAEKRIRVIIDRIYPADQIREAHRYSETNRAKGKILVSFDGSSSA